MQWLGVLLCTNGVDLLLPVDSQHEGYQLLDQNQHKHIVGLCSTNLIFLF